jgi:hypothetical protein
MIMPRSPYHRPVESAPDVQRPRRRVPRWVAALVVGLVVFDVAAAGVVVERVKSVFGAGETRADATGAPTSDGSRARSGQATKAGAELAITQLLDQRAAALVRRDKAAFLATVDPGATAFRAQQARTFDNLADVPVASWQYRLDDADAFELPAVRQAALGRSAFGGLVRLQYRLKGYDSHPVGVNQYLTFVQRKSSWFVAGDADGAAAGKRGGQELWDFGRVAVVRGRASLVLGFGRKDLLDRYAREADRAVPAVTAVWGPGWSRRVIVVVPRTQEQMAALLAARPSEYAQIAAVTTGELGVENSRAAADRIIVNPDAFRQLGPPGRRVVMTHEVTHVATRVSTKPWTPTWLAEGFADYSGYLDSGVSARAAASELVKDIREGKLPTELPSDDRFTTTRKDLAQAYEMGWLACRYIAEKYGRAKLVAFYRAVGRGPDETSIDGAFETVLNTTEPQFTAQWRSYLRDIAN